MESIKIIGKLLAERQKRVVGKSFIKNPLSFIKGRQIMDTTLIANGFLYSRLKGEDPGTRCKVDVEKAYDHVN